MAGWRALAASAMLAPIAATLSRLVPLDRAVRLIDRLPLMSDRTLAPADVAALVSLLPATCLTKALVLHALLRRGGTDSTIVVGAARIDGSFRAHAWVEVGGRTVLGDSATAYAPLWSAT
jgi:hypothetical protein